MLLGTERFGRYKGKQNLCSGHIETYDNGCALEAARRELCEEFKITLSPEEWEARVRCLMFVGKTPVFHLRLSSLDMVLIEALNARIARDLQDESLPGTEKEMQRVAWVNRDTILEGRGISSFAKYVIRKSSPRLFYRHSTKPPPTRPSLAPTSSA